MLDILLARFYQGKKTIAFPKSNPEMPPFYRGLPVIDASKCEENCQACVDSCPTTAIAITQEKKKLTLDMGKCLFCTACQTACPKGSIEMSKDFRTSARKREDLVVGDKERKLSEALEKKILKIFKRSLKLRVVSAGDCNGCSVEVNVLSTIVFDLSRFGIQVVASPRHADGVVITGPVTENMREALKKTYDGVPAPKIVIAVGACAISGGPFRDHPEVHNGADSQLPVDLYIPGCPPHPISILDGLLRLLDRIE